MTEQGSKPQYEEPIIPKPDPRRNLDDVFRRISEDNARDAPSQVNPEACDTDHRNDELLRRLALSPESLAHRRILQRIGADPVGILAGDLLEMMVSQGDTAHERLPDIARNCREAAEICHGKPPLHQVAGVPDHGYGDWVREHSSFKADNLGDDLLDAGVEGAP